MSDAPNVENYTLGKGKVYFARFDSDGASDGELDLGNAPAFEIGTTQETLDHFESMAGIKDRDLQVETSISAQLSFTLDEYAADNLALAFRGAEPTSESQGSGTVAAETVVAKLDKWVKMDYRNVSHIVIAGLVEGTDFEVDFDVGRLKALSTGSVTADESLSVAYDYSSETWTVISGLSNGGAIEGFLRFVGDPEQGIAYEVEVHKVKLRATSPVPFISDEWGTMQYEGEIQKDVANNPTDPWFKIREEGLSGGGS